MVCCSYIVTNGVVAQCEHFLLMSVELDHRSALVLVPLENTAHLNRHISEIEINNMNNNQIHTSWRKDDPDLLTCPLCSPSTTIMASSSLFGIIVSSIVCFTSVTGSRILVYSLTLNNNSYYCNSHGNTIDYLFTNN